MDDLSKAEREIRDDVDTGDDLENRQLGQRRQRALRRFSAFNNQSIRDGRYQIGRMPFPTIPPNPSVQRHPMPRKKSSHGELIPACNSGTISISSDGRAGAIEASSGADD